MNEKKFIYILVIAVSTAITAILCVIQPILIVLMIGAGYGIYRICKHNENQQQNMIMQQQQYIYNCFYQVYTSALRVLPKLSDLLDIEVPKMFSDLYSEPFLINKKGIDFIRTRVRLSKNNQQDTNTLPAVMRLIQQTINQCLICGDLNDIFCYPSVDGKNPILIVENVIFEDGYLVMDWGILDNPKMYNYILQSSKIINISLPSKTDEDF